MSKENEVTFDKEKLKELYGCKNILGPYEGKDGRKRCVIYYEKGNTPSKSLSRVLMEDKLNRVLEPDEEVDHEDNDKTNDDINNLQILTSEENKLKHELKQFSDMLNYHILPCSYCGNLFYLSNADYNQRIKNSDDLCCSRSCGSKYNATNQYGQHGAKFKE
jgi:hypothetical protein